MSNNVHFGGESPIGQPGGPSGEPEGPVGSFGPAPAQSPPNSSQAPTPMQLASQQNSGNPVGEFQEPPPPTIADAPKDPLDAGIGSSLSSPSLSPSGKLSLSVYMGSSSATWQQEFDYTAQLSPSQVTALQSSSAGSITEALQSLSPPPAFTCTNASNHLTRFPANLQTFAKEFPSEYKKFITSFEMNVFNQIHSEQDQATTQMKQTMQQMEND